MVGGHPSTDGDLFLFFCRWINVTADAGNPEKKAQILITGAECRASSVPFSVLLLTSHPFSVPIDPPPLLRVTDRPILQQDTNGGHVRSAIGALKETGGRGGNVLLSELYSAAEKKAQSR